MGAGGGRGGGSGTRYKTTVTLIEPISALINIPTFRKGTLALRAAVMHGRQRLLPPAALFSHLSCAAGRGTAPSGETSLAEDRPLQI